MLIFSETALQTQSEITFYQLFGQSLPQSNWHIKLTITGHIWRTETGQSENRGCLGRGWWERRPRAGRGPGMLGLMDHIIDVCLFPQVVRSLSGVWSRVWHDQTCSPKPAVLWSHKHNYRVMETSLLRRAAEKRGTKMVAGQMGDAT